LRKLEIQDKKRKSRKTGITNDIAPKECSLWLGDIPLVWSRHGGKYRRLRALLRAHLPRSVPPPWIKLVVRKAYRTKQATAEEEISKGEGGGGVYLGYAIVVFRDADEANLVKMELDEIQVSPQSVFTPDELSTNSDCANLVDAPPFTLKVRPVEKEVSSSENNNSQASNSATNNDTETNVFKKNNNIPPPGHHPPLAFQLRPLSTMELLKRTRRLLGDDNNNDAGTTTRIFDDQNVHPDDSQLHEAALAQAVMAYETTSDALPRREVHRVGRLVPKHLRERLLTIIQTLRWAVPNHRQGMTCERYLTLQSKVTNDPFYGELRKACRDLMDWADRTYYYSGIAITKNFVASPHIDDCDQSYQYAISLGDFDSSSGGELVVEGEGNGDGTDEFVNVVTTHNRIARVDGRHVHWVKGWLRDSNGGDRYSLIFYDTSDRHPTPILPLGVDLEYLLPAAALEDEEDATTRRLEDLVV
jgi:hypothetical protein